MEESENPPEVKDDPDHIGFRDGNLFIIDIIPEMFNVDPDTKETYFVQCLEAYGRILSQKLTWNRRDWMGLVFFGTKKWDMDPETKNILTVQKFEEISIKMLSEVTEILNSKAKNYKEMITQTEYPLRDVLWHTARCFDSVKVDMSRRQVILITCRDDPFRDDEAERHRIRLQAKTFSDINVNLRILGLGQDWNHDLFYKDIEMLANKIESEDVRRMLLEDLEVQIKFEARTIAHLPLRIADGLHIRTVISPFSGSAKYLKEVRMCKETNEILDIFRHVGESESDDDDELDEESQDPVTTQTPDETRKAIKCGDELISFDQREIKEIRMPGSTGIDLLGFKQLSLNLRYHIGPTKFIGVEPSASDEEKELFTALLYECEAKEVMAICTVNFRDEPYLANMIPCTRYGGFYLYKIAFFEHVNDLHDYVHMYIHNEQDESDVPIDEAGLALMKKVVKKLRINWNPSMFRNPKLRAQLAYIEALALDTVAEPVEDTTLPATDVMKQRLGSITKEFTEIFASVPEDCAKRQSSTTKAKCLEKHTKFDDYMIQGLIDTARLKDCTVPDLKSMAKSLGAKTTGSKAELIARICQSYAAKNANVSH